VEAAVLVKSWLNGRANVDADGRIELSLRRSLPLAEKIRAAYRWISENAILSPYADVEFGTPVNLDRREGRLALYDGESYSSFLLLPLLTLVTSRRMVFIGAPGRGKTSMATLIGLIAGESLKDVRRSIQHGHPQLTISDLLGSPVPSELIRAADLKEVRMSWREWIGLRVKIIDEYNRIPTKTQSALLSLMADGYAEMYEQVIECGPSAWFLTANDDLGGGTFPVIEALKDRIDLVVRSTPFHAQHVRILADRIATAHSAEEFVPRDIIFTTEELAQADREIRAVSIPGDVLEVLGFFLGQLDFCRQASPALEFMNKDTLHLAGRRVGHVCTEDCPLDKNENLCSQTENGVSPRAYQAILHFAQSLAWFRGEQAVSQDDLRQLLPWVLFDKLKPNPQSAFFQKTEHKILQTDRVSWIRQMFDRALQQFAAYQSIHQPIADLIAEADVRLESLSTGDLATRLSEIKWMIQELSSSSELNAPVHADLLRLKHLHSRYQTLLRTRSARR
jgi:MoxR-like ATPase